MIFFCCVFVCVCVLFPSSFFFIEFRFSHYILHQIHPLPTHPPTHPPHFAFAFAFAFDLQIFPSGLPPPSRARSPARQQQQQQQEEEEEEARRNS